MVNKRKSHIGKDTDNISNTLSSFQGSYKKNKYFLKHNFKTVTLLVLFLLHLFFRFYELDKRIIFGWDQVDQAWAAKRILVDHNYPLVGMIAKLNTGIHIGPAYYYLIAPFYLVFDMHPRASAFFAGLTSIFTFFVLYFVTKKLFSQSVALVAVFIHTVSFFIIDAERIQGMINFIPPLSLIILFSLYKVLINQPKYIFLLAFAVGFSFHIHFTSIFYPIMILCTMPFFPYSRKNIIYYSLAFFSFLPWLVPNIVSEMQQHSTNTRNMAHYIATYYHGFHLRRVLQLTHDAFIEIHLILRAWVKWIHFTFLPIFSVMYYMRKQSKERLILSLLFWLWFIVPWFVFATYKGEITNYYFSQTRHLSIIILAYLTVRLFSIPMYPFKVAVVSFWLFFSFINIKTFFTISPVGLIFGENGAKAAINSGKKIAPWQMKSESYMYYYYTRDKNNE